MGEPERRLSQALRAGLPDARFRRRVPFGPYHADFRSHAPRLITEVDGDTHAGTTRYDAARTRFLQNEGHDVIRFANADVMEAIDGVVTTIAAAVTPTKKGRP